MFARLGMNGLSSSTSLAVLVAVGALTFASPALADGPTASVSTTAGAATTGAAGKTAEAKPGEGKDPSTKDANAKDGDKSGVAKVEEAPPGERASNMTNVDEAFERTYLFLGLRYRGVVLPKFLLDAFVEGGQTIYTNQIGLELDIRKNGFSVIPALSYAEYGTGDILYKDKNAADFVGNYALGNSSLKAIQATVDLLWSAKLHRTVDFEYGVGLGVGFVFGDFYNNWVREGTGPKQYSAGNGKTYVPCETEETQVAGTGCSKRDHQNSQVARVGGYLEPSWANGGSKPNVIPWVAIPQIGIRFKPIKQFESRLSLGVSLTGFWFGLSANYGFERPVNKGPEVSGVKPEIGPTR